MSPAADIFNWLRGLDPRLWQAVIAGVFLAGGWIFNGWQNRRDARALRDEQLRDAHRAIYAEIATNLSNLWDAESLRSYGDTIIGQMREDDGFIPLIPRERNDRLFEGIQSSIHILPRVTIDPIVMYYSQLDAMAAQVEDMRGAAFKALPQARRIVMYQDYIEMRVQALAFGRVANHLIEIYAKSGKDAAEKAAEALQTRAISSPNAGRSDP